MFTDLQAQIVFFFVEQMVTACAVSDVLLGERNHGSLVRFGQGATAA